MQDLIYTVYKVYTYTVHIRNLLGKARSAGRFMSSCLMMILLDTFAALTPLKWSIQAWWYLKLPWCYLKIFNTTLRSSFDCVWLYFWQYIWSICRTLSKLLITMNLHSFTTKMWWKKTTIITVDMYKLANGKILDLKTCGPPASVRFCKNMTNQPRDEGKTYDLQK